jgi:hypothetical protein
MREGSELAQLAGAELKNKIFGLSTPHIIISE